MPATIINGAKFEVVSVETLSHYTTSISPKVPGTAYFIRDVKKIIVDGVAYGFTPDDINSSLIMGMLQAASTNSIAITLYFNDDDKIVLEAEARIAPTAAKAWQLTDKATYDAASTKRQVTTLAPYGSTSTFLTQAEAQFAASGETVGNVGRGTQLYGVCIIDDIGTPGYTAAACSSAGGTFVQDYFYAIVVGTEGTNLLKLSTNGLYVATSDIQTLIDATIAAGLGVTIAPIVSGKVPAEYIPGSVDDVLDVYIRNSFTSPASDWFSKTGTAGIASQGGAALPADDKMTNRLYNVVGVNTDGEVAKYLNSVWRWSGSNWVNVSNPNLKTINGQSVVGSGDLDIMTTWEVITS